MPLGLHGLSRRYVLVVSFAKKSVKKLCERTGATVVARPVLLGAIFKANAVPHNGTFADTMSDVKKKNQVEDLLRCVLSPLFPITSKEC